MLGHPWKDGMDLALSLLRDSMVLMVDLSLLFQEREPWFFRLAPGTGFVANQWISVSAIAALSVPVSGVGLPTTSFGLRVRYKWDVRGREEVGVRAQLTFQGEKSWLSLEVDWVGRRP